MKEQIVDFIALEIAGAVAVAVVAFVVNLIRAPVYIRFEGMMRPRLKVECEFNRIASWGLQIKNEGTDQAEDCQGQPVEMDFLTPQKDKSFVEWLRHQRFRWVGESPSSTSFSIPGKSRAELEVMTRPPVEFEIYDGLRLTYIGENDFSQPPCLPWDYKILTVISIVSKNALPIYAVCLLDTAKVKFDDRLKLLDVKSECPSISAYQQLDSE